MGPLGPASHRPLHHEGQPQDQHIHVPISGQDGMGDECHVNLVARNVGVCLPSDSSHTEGPLEDKRGAVRDTPGGPLVAKDGVVSRPGTECRASTVTTSTSKAAQATKVKRFPSEPASSKTSRLEAITEGVASAGFSQRVAE